MRDTVSDIWEFKGCIWKGFFLIILDEDNKNFCFICQLNKYEYEKSGEIFAKHVQKEHNIWNYANFIIYMKNKTEKDCNGIESKIFKKIKSGDLSWIPFAKDGYSNFNFLSKILLR